MRTIYFITGNKGKYCLFDRNVEVGKTYYYSLEAVTKYNQNEFVNETISVFIKPPGAFKLEQNYPNPFNAITIIKYEIPVRTKVQLKIFNILGQEVKTLVSKDYFSGNHLVIWNGTNNNGIPVSSGIYVYRIQAGEFISVKKMVLIK